MARNKRDFWNRTMTGPRVQQALESLGGNPVEFEKAYNETRRTPGPRAVTPEQTEALSRFAKTRNIEELATALGIKVPAARGFVARAVEAGLI